jgi:hypothetical protein
VADTIRSCLSEGCVGHLVHADGARGGLIDREGVPGQAPPPIGPGDRITGTLDLRECGEQLGCYGGRGILAEQRCILPPSRSRTLVHRAAHRKEHLGRLAHYLIDDVRHGKDGKDGRSKDDDPDSRRCRIQPAPHPPEAPSPAPQPVGRELPVLRSKRQRKRQSTLPRTADESQSRCLAGCLNRRRVSGPSADEREYR